MKQGFVRAIALCVLGIFSTHFTPLHQPDNPHSYLEEAESQGFAGVVLIVQGDDILLREGYGVADRSTQTPFTPQTAFGIGSLSKQFTAAAVLHLAAGGQIELEAPIRHYFEDVPADKAAMTIHHILTHTAGFPAHHFRSDRLEISRQEAVEAIFSTPLAFGIGEDFHYADSGYVLLAALVEQISGQPFQSYLHENLFEPAGMAHTGFFGERLWPDTPAATGYHNSWDQGSPATWPRPTWALLGAGGIISTVDDMHAWIKALNEGAILPAEAVDAMFSPQATIAERFAYGYGWYIEDTSFGGRMIWHAGAGNSHNADMRYFSDSDTLFVVGSNRIDDFFVTDWEHPFFGRFDEMIYSIQTNVDLTYAVLTGDYTVLPVYVDLPGIRASTLLAAVIPVLAAVLVGIITLLRRKRSDRDIFKEKG